MDKEQFLKKIGRLADPAIASVDFGAIEAIRIGELPSIGHEEPPPKEARTREEIVQFSLAINSINHQFWDVQEGRFSRYEFGGSVGALAMMEGLRRWLSEAGSIEAMAREASLGAIGKFFGPIPDPKGRLEALSEALGEPGKAAAKALGEALDAKGSWGVEEAGVVAALLPAGFEDAFLKKAQLCLWMAKGMLEARGFPEVETDLTCFADYQIPKVLRGLGAIRVSEDLARRIGDGELIEPGSPQENALRAATVIACEAISKSEGISAAALDFWLWTKRNDFDLPFHRTKTRKY